MRLDRGPLVLRPPGVRQGDETGVNLDAEALMTL
jgi:hypothetical protein